MKSLCLNIILFFFFIMNATIIKAVSSKSYGSMDDNNVNILDIFQIPLDYAKPKMRNSLI